MTLEIPPASPINVHVSYVSGSPPTGAGPIAITASNPDQALVEEDPAHPGDSAYAIITPVQGGEFVIGAFDGVYRASLPAMRAGEDAPPVGGQEMYLT